MNYYSTFILISDDSPVQASKIPVSNREKRTISEIEYALLHENPGYYTQDELQFEVHMIHKGIPKENRHGEKILFLEKSRACMRASSLPKRFGWGIYFDTYGNAEMIPVETEKYQELKQQDQIKKVKAMKSKK
ncbi:hypothetical protein SAMN05216232_2570 [Virgibacillus subterraneus]|uniref:Uncharacterized protein n=1 Tax=Virgibacillus subterraneus TaxID=621109 RepID=A0A1H9GDK2_9BACI|nr:DUF6157 family protein [Virgibacillus subterraneus]SEQ48225.1 hypothetical protein SAMN05216232_2570 [Virgibacillus subterraneus]